MATIALRGDGCEMCGLIHPADEPCSTDAEVDVLGSSLNEDLRPQVPYVQGQKCSKR